jgi:hypothetical protein
MFGEFSLKDSVDVSANIRSTIIRDSWGSNEYNN